MDSIHMRKMFYFPSEVNGTMGHKSASYSESTATESKASSWAHPSSLSNCLGADGREASYANLVEAPYKIPETLAHWQSDEQAPYNEAIQLRSAIELPTETIQSLGRDRLQYLFDLLRDKWQNDVLLESSATRILDHPSYQMIIQLGTVMVPFIIEDLRKEFNHWSHALYILTGYEPSEKDQGESENLRAAWLDWAEENWDFISAQYGAMDSASA